MASYLHPQIKRMVAEMYDATKRNIVKNLVREKERSHLPWLTINTDLWTAPTTRVQYIGTAANSGMSINNPNPSFNLLFRSFSRDVEVLQLVLLLLLRTLVSFSEAMYILFVCLFL